MSSASRSPAAAPRPRYRFVVEAVLFLTYAAFGLSWIAVTPLLGTLQTEFKVGSAAISLLNTAVSVAKVVAPLVTGALAVRFGLRRTILGGAILVAAAAAVALATRFEVFVVGRFLFGLGGAVVVTLMAPMAMQWFAPDELPVVNGINNVAVNTGIALTLFTTGPLAEKLGWRGALLTYAAVNVALAIAWALLGRERSDGRAAPGKATQAANDGPAPRLVDLWRRKETWIVALSFTAPLALYLAFNTWLPRHHIEAHHMDPRAASRYAGLINLVGIPAAILGGVLSRRAHLRRPILVAAGLALLVGALGAIHAQSGAVLTAAGVLLGVALFIGGSPLITSAMELPGMTARHVSLMFGTMFSVAYAVSSLAPLLVGWMRDRTGSFVGGLTVWAVGSVMLSVGGWLLPAVRRGSSGSSSSSSSSAAAGSASPASADSSARVGGDACDAAA